MNSDFFFLLSTIMTVEIILHFEVLKNNFEYYMKMFNSVALTRGRLWGVDPSLREKCL